MANPTYQVGNKTEGCGHTHKTPAAALACLQSYQDAGAPKSYKIYELLADGSYKPLATPVARRANLKKLGPPIIQPKPIATAIVVESQFLAAQPAPPAPKPERKAPIGKKVQARDLSHLPPVPLHRTPMTDGGLGGNPADRDVVVDLTHVRLLEDPRNGIILLQVEKPTATGSVCVYNNGKRVAAGEVAPETITTLLRPVPNAPSITEAAYQLLNPIVPSVEVTPLAARHLTAVLEASRNETPVMAKLATKDNVPVAKSAKFAAPVTKAAKPPAKVDPKPPAVKSAPVKSAPVKSAPVKSAPVKSAPASATGRKAKFEDSMKITVVEQYCGTANNPHRAGGKAYLVHEAYSKLKTVGDFRKFVAEHGYPAVYLNDDVRDGYVTVG